MVIEEKQGVIKITIKKVKKADKIDDNPIITKERVVIATALVVICILGYLEGMFLD